MPQSTDSTVPLPRILLASNSELVNRSIGKLLGDRFEIIPVTEAEAAWQLVSEGSDFDLLISQLPLAVDGLLERLRQSTESSLTSLPVLVLIGEDDSDELRDQAFAAGATDFIYAPFSRLELDTRVSLHTRLQVARREEEYSDFGENLADIDVLNTLMQRDYFVTRLGQELAFSERHHVYTSVVHLRMLDSDRVTEHFGQAVFAALVKAMVHEIDKNTRGEDSVAYLGEAGFALLLPVTNGIGARTVLSRLMTQLEAKKLRHGGELISVGFCAGLYVRSSRDKLSVDEIMDELEVRVDLAERMGSGQIVSDGSDHDEQYSVEQALNKLRYGQASDIEKQLPRLLGEIKPLLEFARQHDEISFEEMVDSLTDGSSDGS
jgi:diguanylate cyclase (GGDEF)-like protein